MHIPQRIACYTLMALITGLAIAVIFAGIFVCVPIGTFWTFDSTSSRCLTIVTFYRYSSLPNPILDVMMLALPQPIVWKLHLPMQAKIGVAITFLTGSV